MDSREPGSGYERALEVFGDRLPAVTDNDLQAARERLITEALRDIEEPANPVDGDCEIWEPRVRDALIRAGLPANVTLVFGWADLLNNILLLAHRVTTVDGWVVDFTARQYQLQTEVPARWIARRDEYCHLLAEALGVDVSMSDGEGSDVPA